MATYSLTAGTVTSPFCPASWQAVLNEYAQRLSLEIPSINGFVAQTSTPSASDQDKVWIKTSASAPYVLGAYVYQGGAWRLIPAPATATYFVDTGAANTWTISTGESIPDNAAYITGRLWVVRINNTNTGACTFQVDSFTAKSVKKSDNTNLSAGEVVSGQLVLLAYDATSSVFELLTTLSTPTTAATRFDNADALASITTGDAGVTTINTGLSEIGTYNVRLVCQTGEAGYSANDEVDISSVMWDVGASDYNPGYIIQIDGANIKIIQPKDADANNLGIIPNKSTGDLADDSFTPGNWKIRVTAYV